VAEIVVLHLHRTVAEGLGKLSRWQRIAIEASEQSGRLTIPKVTGPYPLREYLAQEDAGCSLLLWEGEQGKTLSDFFDRGPPPPRVRIFIGSEGGLDEEEVRLLTRHGFIPLSLGPRTLRAETAAIAAITILQHRWGDLR
jgi:16S rRNA (uracil1498-N3)-methyltransferase